jgi:hypothetical protein
MGGKTSDSSKASKSDKASIKQAEDERKQTDNSHGVMGRAPKGK